MRKCVINCFDAFSEAFEGAVYFMYLDILGLVTTGIGNLIDDKTGRAPESALSLPWEFDGVSATREQISEEWTGVKHTVPGDPLSISPGKDAARQGYRVLENVTNLRLTKEGVAQLVAGKRDEMWRFMVANHFPSAEFWPADAQLAALSVAWACGANWPALFPQCKAALAKGDFERAANLCHINTDGADRIPNTSDDNRGVIPRNRANWQLFTNAAEVIEKDRDADAFLDPKLAHATVTSATVTAAQLAMPADVVHPALEWGWERPEPREV